MLSSGYFYLILGGAWLSLAVALCSLFIAVVIGFLGALAKLSNNKLWRGLASVYTTIVRGVPDLVWMLLIFYGGTIVVNNVLESMGSQATLDLSPFTAGVVTLGFIYGAYMTETFRGAIMAIPRGQMEAGLAYGMGSYQIFFRITFPQMVRYALSGFTNNWLVLTKSTALVSLLSLQDMTYLAKQAGSATRSPFTYIAFTGALFLLLTAVSLWLLRKLNDRYSLGVKRGTM